jgi:acetoacetyl-CoA synthetase
MGPTIESIAMSGEGKLLWEPSQEAKEHAELTRYMGWLDRGFETYDDLWRWSVEDIEGFWASLWDYFEIGGSYDRVLGSREMPGAEWFPGARLNYTEHLLKQARPGETAIVHASELRPLGELSWDELERQVSAVANGLRRLGVEKGDRVVA